MRNLFTIKLVSISCETELLPRYSSSPLSSRTKEKHEEVIIINVIK